MIKRRHWNVIIPVMVVSQTVMFFGLKLLQHAFPQAFPHIQGPPLLALALFVGLCIGFYVLRPLDPVMNRQPWLRGFVTGVDLGILMFLLNFAS